MNRIIARFQDGRTLKGVTNDFLPAKDRFHVVPLNSPPGTKPLQVLISDLKALFFVRDFTGKSEYTEKKHFDPSKPPAGRKIRVVFKDSEEMVGTTLGYQPERPGFFLVPADAKSNNERCFVVTAATRQVSFI